MSSMTLATRVDRLFVTFLQGSLVPEDAIQVVISTDSTALRGVMVSHVALIDGTVKQPIVCCATKDVVSEVARKAVEARGEGLGEEVVSDSTTVSPGVS